MKDSLALRELSYQAVVVPVHSLSVRQPAIPVVSFAEQGNHNRSRDRRIGVAVVNSAFPITPLLSVTRASIRRGTSVQLSILPMNDNKDNAADGLPDVAKNTRSDPLLSANLRNTMSEMPRSMQEPLHSTTTESTGTERKRGRLSRHSSLSSKHASLALRAKSITTGMGIELPSLDELETLPRDGSISDRSLSSTHEDSSDDDLYDDSLSPGDGGEGGKELGGWVKAKEKGMRASWKVGFFVVDKRGLVSEYKDAEKMKCRRKFKLRTCYISRMEGLSKKKDVIYQISISRIGVPALLLRFDIEQERDEWADVMQSFSSMLSQAELQTAGSEEAGALVESDEKGKIMRFTPLSEKLFGWKSSEMIGKNVTQLIPQAVASSHGKYVERYLNTMDRRLIGNPRRVSALHRDGFEFPVLITLSEYVHDGHQRFIAEFEDLRTSELGDGLFGASQLRIEKVMQEEFDTLSSAYLTELSRRKKAEDQLAQVERKLRVAQTLAKMNRGPKKQVSMSPSDLGLTSRRRRSVQDGLSDWEHVRVRKRIAAGGSGAVIYTVSVAGWLCVMKELNLAQMVDLSAQESILCEVEVLESLPYHPNVVRYLHHTVDDVKIRWFMSMYDGSLSEYIRRRESPFCEQAIAKMIKDCCEGVLQLHTHRFIHRDIKTDNVFYIADIEGEISQCAIGDLDTVTQLMKGKGPNECIGTPGYTAPEVMNVRSGSQGYGASADVWSLGMVLYELMTLKPPYDGLSYFQVQELSAEGVRAIVPKGIAEQYPNLTPLYERMTEKKAKSRVTVRAAIERLSKLLPTSAS